MKINKFLKILLKLIDNNYFRFLFYITLDLTIITSSIFLTLFFIQDSASQDFYKNIFSIKYLFFINCFSLIFLYISKWYASLSRFVGSKALYSLLLRTGIICIFVFFPLKNLLDNNSFLKGNILFALFFLTFELFSRILVRDIIQIINKRVESIEGQKIENVIIYGAGQAGKNLYESFKLIRNLKVIGFIDDDKKLSERKINGINIYHPFNLEELIQKYDIKKIFIGISKINKKAKEDLIRKLSRLKIEIIDIPSSIEIAYNKYEITNNPRISLNDVIDRKPLNPRVQDLENLVKNKVVVVTGAGGSIGSELCKQLFFLSPKKLLIIENHEYSLYKIQLELKSLNNSSKEKVDIHSFLIDIKNKVQLLKTFENFSPNVIFHTAAYKHVPLLENNICSGIANNILTTKILLDASILFNVEKFILISSDKAVRPTNIMGASKRVCEILVQNYSKKYPHIIFSMVRFGNVIGSSGSVLPLFIKQIQNGGPLTVTHPEVNRFFMTIPEAVELILHTAKLAKGGEIFLLDMGKPIKILNIAEKLIKLMGYSVAKKDNQKGIKIVFTGLRPGEKLFEELLISSKDKKTVHPLIRVAREDSLDPEIMNNLLDDITISINNSDSQKTIEILSKMVKEFNYS